eukprot:Skav234600  [mRNA]  locus=scaffold5214:226187:246766:- [translate_table: standard]
MLQHSPARAGETPPVYQIRCVVVRNFSDWSKVLLITTGGTIDKVYPRTTGGWGFEIGEPAVDRTHGCGTDRDPQMETAWPSKNIVITHGTDTLIETAKFLGSKLAAEGGKRGEDAMVWLGSLTDQRICLTGAMRPERFVDSDAHFNLGGIGLSIEVPRGMATPCGPRGRCEEPSPWRMVQGPVSEYQVW